MTHSSPPPFTPAIADVQADLRELTYAFHTVSGYLLNILNEGDTMVVCRFADDLDELANVGGRSGAQNGLVATGAPNKHLQMLADALRRQA